MKSKFFLSALFLLFFSCEPRVKNDIATLNEIFEKDKIELEIREQGCFSGFDEFFVLYKDDGSYQLKNKKSTKVKVIPYDRIQSLKSYLKTRIGKKNEHYCTSSQYVKFSHTFKAVDYYHEDCSEEMDKLNNILGYYDLINNDNE